MPKNVLVLQGGRLIVFRIVQIRSKPCGSLLRIVQVRWEDAVIMKDLLILGTGVHALEMVEIVERVNHAF